MGSDSSKYLDIIDLLNLIKLAVTIATIYFSSFTMLLQFYIYILYCSHIFIIYQLIN